LCKAGSAGEAAVLLPSSANPALHNPAIKLGCLQHCPIYHYLCFDTESPLSGANRIGKFEAKIIFQKNWLTFEPKFCLAP